MRHLLLFPTYLLATASAVATPMLDRSHVVTQSTGGRIKSASGGYGIRVLPQAMPTIADLEWEARRGQTSNTAVNSGSHAPLSAPPLEARFVFPDDFGDSSTSASATGWRWCMSVWVLSFRRCDPPSWRRSRSIRVARRAWPDGPGNRPSSREFDLHFGQMR